MDKNLFKQAAEAEGGPTEDVGDPEDNPAYRQALEMMLSKLYEDGAAQGIGEAIAAAPDKVKGLAEQTLLLLDVMEQMTDGSVPDELVMPFVIEATQEVIQIAMAAGVNIGSAEMAAAIGEILAGVVDNLGGDSSAIRQEMANIDPGEIARAMEGEDEPV